MASPTARQSLDRPTRGPGPDHTPGAWTMEPKPRTDSGRELKDTATMTKEQGKILKKLAVKARELHAYSPTLSAESAETRIRILKAKLEKDRSGEQHKPK
jgi:hypothetical protein